ncbi:MAG: O-antigen ligase family protein [Crocinitomicaceae bacterium]
MLIIIAGVLKYAFQPVAITKIGFVLLMPVLFIILILGQLYTDNLTLGWTLIERSLSILLVPIALISFSKITIKQEKVLIWTLVTSGFVASLYCIGFQINESIAAGSIYTKQNTTHFLFNRFMHHRLSAPLQLHAIYMSLYIAFITAFLFDLLLSAKMKVLKKTGLVVLILFFGVVIFLLKSAIIAFSLALVLIYILWTRLRSEKIVFKLIFYTLSLGVLLIAFYFVKSKIEFINLDYVMSDPKMGMLAIRLSIWENALNVIGSNWFFGVGTGDADLALLNEYAKSGFSIGYEKDFNCHNMYLQYWLGNGIIALVIFISYFILLFKKAMNHKNAVFVGFLILFACFSFTESTMRVQKGMVFFIIFSTLFYFNPSLWNNHKKQ